jgi:hypothetical protein
MKSGGSGHSSWFGGLKTPNPETAEAAHWEATRAQTMLATQVMAREGDEAQPGRGDIGRRVGADEHELFVSCAAAEAMLQQLELLRPDFLALHDLGCVISRRLLAGVAAASQRRMQRLVIRRQGYGTPLATLQFIEWSHAGSATIRLYSTEIDADTVARQALATTLLAYSRLGVIFVGDLPPHALASALDPLRTAMRHGAWSNTQLLMLPLASASALASQAAQLGSSGGVLVRTTPQVSRPAEAWAFLSGTWNRLREQLGASGRHLPVLAGVAAPAPARTASAPAPAPVASLAAVVEPASAPLPMRPMPEVPRAGARAAPSASADLDEYALRLLKISGMLGCCIFDNAAHRVLASAGDGIDADALRRQAEVLLDTLARCADALAIGVGVPDLALTLQDHHLVLRAVPGRAQRMLIALLDKERANLTLARLQIQRLGDEDALTDAPAS